MSPGPGRPRRHRRARRAPELRLPDRRQIHGPGRHGQGTAGPGARRSAGRGPRRPRMEPRVPARGTRGAGLPNSRPPRFRRDLRRWGHAASPGIRRATGLGFGGGCLPKDIRAFQATAREKGTGLLVDLRRWPTSSPGRCWWTPAACSTRPSGQKPGGPSWHSAGRHEGSQPPVPAGAGGPGGRADHHGHGRGLQRIRPPERPGRAGSSRPWPDRRSPLESKVKGCPCRTVAGFLEQEPRDRST
jgi:hypothetical protein